MCNLPQEDRICFKCYLADCRDTDKNCPRKNFINSREEYKAELHRKKMTTTLKRTEPIVVR